MYSSIYEISLFDILPIIIIAVIILVNIISIIVAMLNKGFNKIAGIIIALFLLFCDVLIVSSQIDDAQIYSSYLNNDFLTVEGSIENYTEGSVDERTPESFYINDVYFEYYDNWEFGYSKYGKLKDGEKLKASYIYDEFYETNRIVRLEKINSR